MAFVAAIGILQPAAVRAQTFETVGIRAQGMGGAFVAVADDATATWWNPAGLAAGAYFNALVEYDRARDTDETRATGVAIAFPALGLSYYRLPISQMRPPATTATPAAGRQDQGVLNQFGASVGESLGSHLVMSTTLKVLSAGDTHADADIGALAIFGGLHLGVSVRNVRETSFGSGVDELDLRRQARAGVALVGRGRGGIQQVTVAFDADLTKTTTAVGDVRHVAAGIELWTGSRRLGLRGGGSLNTAGATQGAASGGLSLAVRSSTYLEGTLTGGPDRSKRSWGFDLRVTF
jgi:hypothetical protein